MAKKAFTAASVGTAVLYGLALYWMLFRMPSRGMVLMAENMLDNYNYWNSVNLIPFRTIADYLSAAMDASARGHAIRNLVGNLLLLFPLGFYLPFFLRKMNKLWLYCAATAAGIIAIEVAQLLTLTGSLDIDDFILNFAGAALGFVVFHYTPARKLLGLCAWRKITCNPKGYK